MLGPAEASTAMLAFLLILIGGGWSWGVTPDSELLAVASGTVFTAIVLGQLANAFACRSESRWVGHVGFGGNPLLLFAIAFELAMLMVFLTVPRLPELLGGAVPSATGWALAALAIPVVWLADAAAKGVRAWRRNRPTNA